MFIAVSRIVPRNGIVVAAFLVVALPLTLTASPIPFASSSYYYQLNANTLTSRTLNTVSSFNSITFTSGDLSWASPVPPPASSQAVLSLYTILSQTPAAHIEASVSTSGASAWASGSGEVSIGYSTRVRQRTAPPLYSPSIPVRFRGVGFGEVGGSGGFASGISITYPGGFRSWSTDAGTARIEVDELLWISPDALVGIALTAACNITAVGGADGYCSADVDPMMFLDQEAWDSLLGNNSFLLDEFFELESSANLVPEPVLWPIAAFAAAGILIRRKRG